MHIHAFFHIFQCCQSTHWHFSTVRASQLNTGTVQTKTTQWEMMGGITAAQQQKDNPVVSICDGSVQLSET